MKRDTTKLCIALLAWILLLHPQDHHAAVCNENHLNSTATSIHMDRTFLKYKVQCLVPHGATVIIKNRKTYKEDEVRVQIQKQSIILSSDPHPASCKLIWTDPGGRRHTENCAVTQDADLSVADKGQTAAPTETHVEISSVGSGSKNRWRHSICLSTIFLIIIVSPVLYHVLKKIYKKRIHYKATNLQDTTETVRYNRTHGSHTWHGSHNKIIWSARRGSAVAALLLHNQTDANHTWHAGCRNLWATEEMNILMQNRVTSDWQEEDREEQSDPDS